MSVPWIPLTSANEVDTIRERSEAQPCVIFKHSTRCGISAAAKMRLEDDWSFDTTAVQPYYLDLLQNRSVSNLIAETFQVHHESPQLLLIHHGECVYEASHLGITVDELLEALEQVAAKERDLGGF